MLTLLERSGRIRRNTGGICLVSSLLRRFYHNSATFYVSILICLFILQCLILWGWTHDDAYISYRYAENLINGNGLTFNVGDSPVEGYSNFLWVLLLVFFKLLGFNLELTSKILSIIIGCINIIVLFKLGRLMFAREELHWILISILLFISNPSELIYTISGLETQLFTLLVLLGIYFYVLELKGTNSIPISSIFLALASLTRPEGPLLFAVLFFWSSYRLLRVEKSRKNYFIWISLFAIIYVPYTIWRISYFGDIFPNTYYAKVSTLERTFSKIALIKGGLGYVHYFFRDHGGILLFVLTAIMLLLYRRERQLHLVTFPITLVIAAYLFFITWVGGDWMQFYRFFLRYHPFLHFYVDSLLQHLNLEQLVLSSVIQKILDNLAPLLMNDRENL